MAIPLLKTKLHIPATRAEWVSRPRLLERLNAGIDRKLTLVSAPAGFGKTTLVSEWVHAPDEAFFPVATAWLSLGEGDNDPARFLAYLIGALRTVEPSAGEQALNALRSPQPPPIEGVLTSLINDLATIADRTLLVLDDYHLMEAPPAHEALAFLLEHLPAHMHLVIATREDPPLPLARLRAGGHLTELRAADLRFTSSEAADFLNQVMKLDLAAEDIAVLERRTEGWIAGLQLAAISLQGRADAAGFIESFAGSHRFVLDYLLEEVLDQQSPDIQRFLLRTSILDRLCGPLCDAVCSVGTAPAARGQETLEHLERVNLFIVPLDDERRWYRYHHLFADLLRQRLHQQEPECVAKLHIRASQWYEDNKLAIEAFNHAATAHDVERTVRLIGGDRIPLHLRGAVTAVLNWLESLPNGVLDARPWLWWRYASLLLISGQTTGVEEKLQSAETAIAETAVQDTETRDLLGLIAAARATLALTRYDVEGMIAQSCRALECLGPDSLTSRASANWTLGYGYFLRGERAAARQAFDEAVSISQEAGDTFTTILATIGLGNVHEAENQLHRAAETYRRVLELAGEQPLQIINEAHHGLARVLYEWNELDGAEHHGQRGLELARQYDSVIDRYVSCELFLARLKLAQGDVDAATAMLAEADQIVRRESFVHRMPEVAAAQVLTLLRQGHPEAAAALAQTHELPVSQARVHLALGDLAAALAVLEPRRQAVEARGWQDELLRILVIWAVALHAQGEEDEAFNALGDALAMAKPGGFIRIFVDEGAPMAQLLSKAAGRGVMPAYVAKLLAAYGEQAEDVGQTTEARRVPRAPALVDPLTPRELEVLELIAEGLSNREIGKRLFIALSTVKGHTTNIYGKLHVHRRTEAVARARELGLL